MTITKNKWSIKDRTYILKNDLSPLTFTMKSKNIYWFDEEQGFERELKYTINQKTPFVDDFKGDARLAHIVFEDGMLVVPKQKQTLQTFDVGIQVLPVLLLKNHTGKLCAKYL